jgi:BirA family biotin operon repressor/biotin-[acetyl-CoA-carboxylase] ligase
MPHTLSGAAEAVWEAVAPTLPGFTVEVLPEIDSTNSELMRRARNGQWEPVLLLAHKQTAGRGRLGRQWISDLGAPQQGGAGNTQSFLPSTSLTFSLGLPLAPFDWSGLSLAVGLSVAGSLHPDIRLKWPNDLWLHGRKLGGILIETANIGASSGSRYAVVGMGLNLSAPAAAGLSTPPAGLAEVWPGVTAAQALVRLAPALVQTLQVFAQQGFAPFQARFNAVDALAGLGVTLSDGTTGLAQGVDASGALRVQTATGWQCVSSAEVSVRPVGMALPVAAQAPD